MQPCFRAEETSRSSPWAVQLVVGMLTLSLGRLLFRLHSLQDGPLGQSPFPGWPSMSYLQITQDGGLPTSSKGGAIATFGLNMVQLLALAVMVT